MNLHYLNRNLRYIINQWINVLILAVFKCAYREKITRLYMASIHNSHGRNIHKKNFFYNNVPQKWDFELGQYNLRGKKEKFWMRQLRVIKIDDKKSFEYSPTNTEESSLLCRMYKKWNVEDVQYNPDQQIISRLIKKMDYFSHKKNAYRQKSK